MTDTDGDDEWDGSEDDAGDVESGCGPWAKQRSSGLHSQSALYTPEQQQQQQQQFGELMQSDASQPALLSCRETAANTAKQVGVSLDTKHLHHITPSLVDFPSLRKANASSSGANAHKCYEIKPSSTPLISVRSAASSKVEGEAVRERVGVWGGGVCVCMCVCVGVSESECPYI